MIVCQVMAQGPAITPQNWAPLWSSQFTEKTWFFLQGNNSITGTWTYQNDNTAVRQHLSRNNGKSDRYCGTIFPFENTPCNQLIMNSKRYMIFPEKKYCCTCCTSAEGCGVIKPDWAAKADFQSTYTSQGTQVNKFLIKGLQNNWYEQTADNTGKPIRIYQEPISDMVFDPATYTTTPDLSVFALPTGYGDCEKSCPFLSLCTLVKFAS